MCCTGLTQPLFLHGEYLHEGIKLPYLTFRFGIKYTCKKVGM